MSTFQPRKFKLPESPNGSDDLPPIKERKVKRNHQRGRFLKGPIPLSWLMSAAQLPGKTIVVGIVIWFRAGLCSSRTITLPSTVLSLFGVDRSAKLRGLKALEGASLITVERRIGKNPNITINIPSDET